MIDLIFQVADGAIYTWSYLGTSILITDNGDGAHTVMIGGLDIYCSEDYEKVKEVFIRLKQSIVHVLNKNQHFVNVGRIINSVERSEII